MVEGVSGNEPRGLSGIGEGYSRVETLFDRFQGFKVNVICIRHICGDSPVVLAVECTHFSVAYSIVFAPRSTKVE